MAKMARLVVGAFCLTAIFLCVHAGVETGQGGWLNLYGTLEKITQALSAKKMPEKNGPRCLFALAQHFCRQPLEWHGQCKQCKSSCLDIVKSGNPNEELCEKFSNCLESCSEEQED